ncbi:MAG: vWA domain-containing protein [Polyangiales bacterium]
MRYPLSIVLVASVGLVILACGTGDSGPRSGTGGTGGTLSCTTLTVPPPGCDEACPSGSDSECELGTFCLNGVCSAQCTADEGCAQGSTCNARGRCVMGTGGTGGTGNTGGNGCQSIQVTPTRSVPNVMFLVDQSGSMTENFAGQPRWTAAHGAITEIVADLESIVRFGLTTYTSNNGNSNPPCPRLPVAGDPFAASPRVDFGLNNSSAISNNSIYPSAYPNDAGGDTPTGDSIDALVGVIQASPPPAEGPTIIVLATDGEPDTCEQPNPQNGQAEAVTAATAAHAAGLDVFILSVGNDVSDAHLQQMANVGVGKPANESGDPAPFWKATTPELLADAFQQIISDSISCEVQIDKPFDDVTLACAEGDVRLNGTPLSCPSEWQVKPGVNNVIELVGSACDTFKSGSSTFTAEFPCGAIVVE